MSSRQLSSMAAKGLLIFLSKRFGGDDAHTTADHMAAAIDEAWDSSVAGKLQITAALLKAIPAPKQEDLPAPKQSFDIPWLNRSRLAYKDPARLAAVRAESAGVVVDIESKEIK